MGILLVTLNWSTVQRHQEVSIVTVVLARTGYEQRECRRIPSQRNSLSAAMWLANGLRGAIIGASAISMVLSRCVGTVGLLALSKGESPWITILRFSSKFMIASMHEISMVFLIKIWATSTTKGKPITTTALFSPCKDFKARYLKIVSNMHVLTFSLKPLFCSSTPQTPCLRRRVEALVGQCGQAVTPVSSRKPTSRSRFATADPPEQVRESHRGAVRVANGTRAGLHSHPRIRGRRHARP